MPKPLSDTDNPTIAAYLPGDLARRARTHAKETGRSLSSVVTESLTRYFERLDLLDDIEHEIVLQRLAAGAAEAIRAEEGR